MELVLTFNNLPPMPRNRSHMLAIRDKRPMNIKTPLARDFENDVGVLMGKFSEDIKSFVSNFDKKKHYIKAEYYFYTPEDILITKDGHISSKSVDTDAHKVFRDSIYRCLNLDDKLERDSRFFTPISWDDNHHVVVTLKLESLSCLNLNLSF